MYIISECNLMLANIDFGQMPFLGLSTFEDEVFDKSDTNLAAKHKTNCFMNVITLI